MKLSSYDEVARLVPEKQDNKLSITDDPSISVYIQGRNDVIKALTPLLSLEVGIDEDKIGLMIYCILSKLPINSYIGKEQWTGKHYQSVRKLNAQSIVDAIASSNVIEIRKV